MNTKINFITILLVFALASCKKENTFTDYKYAYEPNTLTCDNLDTKLYNEALYSFEADILSFYGKNNPNYNQLQAYNQFIREGIYGRANLEGIISKHSTKVFEALKNDKNLWISQNGSTGLNYKSPFLDCISKNMSDKSLKTTFNALISTNSMSPKLFGAPLLTNYRFVQNDKYLATYVALDLYYSKFFDIDFAKINFDKPDSPVDFNNVPQQPVEDPHAGHNH